MFDKYCQTNSWDTVLYHDKANTNSFLKRSMSYLTPKTVSSNLIR